MEYKNQKTTREDGSKPKVIVVTSGYFIPLRGRHIDYLEAARKLADRSKGALWVIMNNDRQQFLREGKIIMPEDERMKIVRAIKYVDNIVPSIDTDDGLRKTLEMLGTDKKYRGAQFVFVKSGDKRLNNLPEVATQKPKMEDGSKPKVIVVTSGYFNPLHGGHIDYLAAARKLADNMADKIVDKFGYNSVGEHWVIVNNDRQQISKKGGIIMSEDERMKIVRAIKYVDNIVLSIDTDGGQCKTLEMLSKDKKYEGTHFVFAKSGDRTIENIPEVATCRGGGIEMVFDVGEPKSDSSSRIIEALGLGKKE